MNPVVFCMISNWELQLFKTQNITETNLLFGKNWSDVQGLSLPQKLSPFTIILLLYTLLFYVLFTFLHDFDLVHSSSLSMSFCLYFCLTRRTLITSEWHCDYECYLKEVLLTDLLFLSTDNKAMKYFFLILNHFLIGAENRSVTTLKQFPISQFNRELNNIFNFFFFSKSWFGHCNWCSAILLRLISQQLRWCWVWQLARRRRAQANQLRLLCGTKRCDAGA